MKKLVLLLISFLLLCSCAGTGKQQLVEVPDHNVSFMSPPSGWKKLYSATSPQLPTGEVVPGGVFSAAWSKGENAIIMFFSFKNTEKSKGQANRDSVKAIIYYRVKQFEQQCNNVRHFIESESEGTFREGINYNKIEATVKCNDYGSYYSEKSTNYILDSGEHLYMLGIAAVSDKYEMYLNDFDQFFENISFVAEEGKNISQKKQSLERTYVEIQEPDVVFAYGKIKYTVNAGDTLEILSSHTCRGGSGKCWMVKNIKTGEKGAVSVKQMQTYHRVYSSLQPEIDDTVTQNQEDKRLFPELNVKGLQGKEVNLKAHKGKIIIINLFTTSCPPCKQEIPHFVELTDKYKKELVVIGFAYNKSGVSVVTDFAEEMNINYRLCWGSKELFDYSCTLPWRNKKTTDAVCSGGVPLTIVIDKAGYVVNNFFGYRDKSTIEKIIKSLL